MTWNRNRIATARGEFEVFVKGEGAPLCITHHYSEFNETGDYFAEAFTETNQVFLINLREAGNSAKAEQPHQLSMLETVLDLEAVRERLGFGQWGFAGHSTGGMLGVLYGIYFSDCLSFNILVGAAAREYMTFSAGCIYNPKHPQFQKMQDLMENLKLPDLPPEEKAELKIQRTKLSLADPNKYEDYFSKDIRKELSAARLNFFSRELHVFDVTRKLTLITAPALIICGKHDVQCPLEYSVEMSEGISDSELAIFDHSNHYPFLEESERFARVYASFIKRLDEEGSERHT